MDIALPTEREGDTNESFEGGNVRSGLYWIGDCGEARREDGLGHKTESPTNSDPVVAARCVTLQEDVNDYNLFSQNRC